MVRKIISCRNDATTGSYRHRGAIRRYLTYLLDLSPNLPLPVQLASILDGATSKHSEPTGRLADVPFLWSRSVDAVDVLWRPYGAAGSSWRAASCGRWSLM